MRFDRILAIGLMFALVSPVHAGDPPPFPEFTFKMSKPPKKGATNRINVQIEPQAAKPKPKSKATDEDATEVATAVVPKTATYDWFWTSVPDEIGVNSTERLTKALAGLNKAPGGGSIPGPRLQDLQGIARTQGGTILRETIGTDVSPALVLAVIAVESGGRDVATSNKGAQGLMQLMPDTAKRFGVEDSLSADQNIKGGVAYLSWLLREFEGDAILALAGYNAGEGAVKKHQGVPPYAETRDYIPKVLAAFEVARGLCKTRPQLITDACALNLAMN